MDGAGANSEYQQFLARFPFLGSSRTVNVTSQVGNATITNTTTVVTFPDKQPLSERGVAAAAAGTILVTAVRNGLKGCSILSIDTDRLVEVAV
jgi:hypothetical protein